MFRFDKTLCCGCGACSVACMDQNDTDVSRQEPYRVVSWEGEDYVSRAVRHGPGCIVRMREGLTPPCVRVCPTGALRWEL